jgi:hypothetical protein
MIASNYFSIQGKVYIGDRILAPDRDADGFSTVVSGLQWLGNTPKAEITIDMDQIQHKETYTGLRQTDFKQIRSRGATLNMTVETFNHSILSLGLHSNFALVNSGTASNVLLFLWDTVNLRWTELDTDLPVVGKTYQLGYMDNTGNFVRYLNINTETLVITDSTSGTPKTLVKDTNYKVTDVRLGKIKILDITTGGTFAGPLKAAFSFGIVDDIIPTPLKYDRLYPLSHQNVSDFVLRDSALTPVFVPTNLYTLNSDHGSILIPVSSKAAIEALNLTAPVFCRYSFGPSIHVPLVTHDYIHEKWIRFEGINTADRNRPVVLDLYRVLLDPFKSLPLINEELGQYEVTGQAIMDDTKPADGVMGQVGRFVMV